MNAFLTLTAEAVRDAFRRRIVAVVVVVSLLSLMLVDSCTSCGPGQLRVDGELREMVDVSAYTGSLTFVVLALWCIALAGVLAAEHLATPLCDGTATLILARPVGRVLFAFSRLCGALGIAWLTAAVLLGGTAFLLHTRSALPLAPALWAAGACGLGAAAVGALAMTASLFVPRVASVMLVFAAVGVQAFANAVGLATEAGEGVLAWIDRLGPPLASAPVLALDPWIAAVDLPADPLATGARLLLWVAGSWLALGLVFRRIELSG